MSVSTIFPLSSQQLPLDIPKLSPEKLPEYLDRHPEVISRYPYLADLARIEYHCYHLQDNPPCFSNEVKERIINPTLELLPVQWSSLPELLSNPLHQPVQQEGFVLIYQKPDSNKVHVETPTGYDLLALKLMSEGMNPRQAATEANVSIGNIEDILSTAINRGILLEPKSKIVRTHSFPRGSLTDPDHFIAPTFTLQWHITQICDLHCRHCYDRTDRKPLELNQAISVLDNLYDFCRQMHVVAQVTFTGGNPLLYPHFNQLYQEAAERGFMIAILGNPMPERRIKEMVAIKKPEFYQVSLEGLEEHNDYMRGKGHFNRTINFLRLLKDMEIYSMVMLTLTQDNKNEILELAEFLKDRVDQFTFNRLAMVGEGIDLVSFNPADFPEFLKQYIEASKENPCMSLKDNFFNLVFHKTAMPYTGGCTGFGCGAAFNFVSLLPEGEVHACRKFHSPIGNIQKQSLVEIYQSEAAKRYRGGSSACKDCEIRPVCGGCLAVTSGFGKDIFTEIDPYCFR